MLTTEEIPTLQGYPFFDQRTVIDGVELLFSFTWNDRAQRWYLDIADQAGTSIVRGLKLVPSFPLCTKVRDTRLPPGEILLIGELPGLDTLGVNCSLVYIKDDGTAPVGV